MDICVMGFYNIWQLDIANRRGDPGNPQVRGGGRNRPALCGRQLRRCIDRQRPACDAGTGESSARDRPRIASGRHLDRTELYCLFHCYPVFPIVKEAGEDWRQMVGHMIRWRDEI